MARNDELVQVAKKAADAWRNTDSYYQAAQIIDMLVEELESATLTQPNEPLTLEELRLMAEPTPVWWDWVQGWVLARKGIIMSWNGRYHNSGELRGDFYRRPPEGEA